MTDQAPTTLAEWWTAVRYIIEWADGQTITVEQPPLDAPPPEYRAAA